MMKEVHVAVGVVRRGDTVLIARRPDHVHQGGLLEFPGGKVEPGERVQDALVRELHEEVGIDVCPMSLRPVIGIQTFRKQIGPLFRRCNYPGPCRYLPAGGCLGASYTRPCARVLKYRAPIGFCCGHPGYSSRGTLRQRPGCRRTVILQACE